MTHWNRLVAAIENVSSALSIEQCIIRFAAGVIANADGWER
jgi:hypothetical protein